MHFHLLDEDDNPIVPTSTSIAIKYFFLIIFHSFPCKYLHAFYVISLVAAEVCDDGAVVEYSCEHGFSFSGDFNNKTSECVEGVWTGAPLHGCTGIQYLIVVLCSI